MPGALSDEARERAARVARDLLEADPRLPATEPFGAGLRTGQRVHLGAQGDGWLLLPAQPSYDGSTLAGIAV